MNAAGHLMVRPGSGLPALASASRDWGLPPIQQEPGAVLRALLKAVMRRSRLIIGTLLVLNVAAFIAVQTIKPRYTAEASLIIGSRQAQVLDLKAVLAGLSGDSEAIESEIQLLRSRKVARAVVQQLRLDERQEFSPVAKAPGLMSRAAQFGRERWNDFAERYAPAWQVQAPALPEAAAPRDPLSATVENVLRRLSVTAKGRSRVVSITFDSSDPVLAASVANEFVNTYIADQLRQKREATANAHKWLEDRVAEMREQVINADQAVAAYRRRAGITPSRNGTLLTEQISALGEQVMQARTARSNAEARVRALQAGGARLDTLPEVQASATIQALRAQESTATAQAAELSRSYGDQHPRVAAARASAGAIEARIRAETGKVAASLAEEARTMKAREEALSTSLARLRSDVAAGTESEVELHALQHEAEANRALYDRLLARSRETNVEGGLQQPDAQIVSPADPPELPSFPNPLIILPIFFLASCIATALLVFGLEARDTGFSSMEQVELTLGIPALGVVPRLRRSERNRHEIGNDRQNRNQSAFAEAVRSLHTSLMLSGAERPPKVVLVTSAVPDEGRSSIVLSLARLMSNCGKRVVVIDCDLRRPALHKAFNASRSPGLTDCLAGRLALVDALQPDTASPALLLPAGSPGGVSPDLLGSDAMRALIAELSERFDLVLLDSSPILAVSDTRNLCRLADRTVLAVRWQDTRRYVVAAAMRQILDAGGHLAGVLLSVVDLKEMAKHSTTGSTQRRIGLYLSE